MSREGVARPGVSSDRPGQATIMQLTAQNEVELPAESARKSPASEVDQFLRPLEADDPLAYADPDGAGGGCSRRGVDGAHQEVRAKVRERELERGGS